MQVFFSNIRRGGGGGGGRGGGVLRTVPENILEARHNMATTHAPRCAALR